MITLRLDPSLYSQQEYNDLVDQVLYHNDIYYNQSRSEISDIEYDQLYTMLVDIEKLHPDWIVKSSPTQSLASQAVKQDYFKKAKHSIPLLSLENTYNAQDIEDRHASILRMLPKIGKEDAQLSYTIEPKYDGISVELIYKEGKFVQAITRGDGFEGEDVTENAKTIVSIPKSIPHLEELHLRGEIVMPKSAFEALNIIRMKNGEPLFANPRNAASGSIKQLDPNITASRGLQCYVYDIL